MCLIHLYGNKGVSLPLWPIRPRWFHTYSPCAEPLGDGHEGMWAWFGSQSSIALNWHSRYSGTRYSGTWLYCWNGCHISEWSKNSKHQSWGFELDLTKRCHIHYWNANFCWFCGSVRTCVTRYTLSPVSSQSIRVFIDVRCAIYLRLKPHLVKISSNIVTEYTLISRITIHCWIPV